jgi:predicted MFS family arabinose efflux permease
MPANAPARHHATKLSGWLTVVFAIASGMMVANIYYTQSLVRLIAPTLGLRESLSGLIVTLTQLGYGTGLIMIGSLTDLVENRLLIQLTLIGTFLGLIAIATSSSGAGFLTACFVVGVCAVGTQVLVPLAASLAVDEKRGRVVGNVMGGLLAGIMLSRPFASFVAARFGWRAVFWASAALMAVLFMVLRTTLPQRRPSPGMHYGQILLSTMLLIFTEPLLRRRSIYQMIMFAGFNLFWTAAPLMLHAYFGFSQIGIAFFALAGAGGAFAAPVAGRLADRGFARPSTGLAMLAAIAAFLVTGWAASTRTLGALVAGAILLDAAIQTSHITSMRLIYGLRSDLRGRLNAVYMATGFIGGAAGAALGSITFSAGGWWLTALTGMAMALLAGGYFLTEQPAALAAARTANS